MEVTTAASNFANMKYRPDLQEKAARLRALGLGATAGQIAEVVGDDTWAYPSCHNCGKASLKVVEVGQEPDWDSSTAQICLECAEAAVAALRASL